MFRHLAYTLTPHICLILQLNDLEPLAGGKGFQVSTLGNTAERSSDTRLEVLIELDRVNLT